MRYGEFVVIIVILLLLPQGGRAQSCVDGECHAAFEQAQYVHMPAQGGQCDICHVSNGSEHPEESGQEFSLVTEDVPELCANCHEVNLGQEDQHMPVSQGMCTTCHSPHYSNQPYLMAAENQGELCGMCHSEGMEDKAFVHGPTAVGACGVCHTSHGNTGNNLLQAESSTEICYRCHIDQQEELSEVQFIHGPVSQNCAGCHNPHESDLEYFLPAEGKALCYTCHVDIEDMYINAASKHEAIENDQECMNCHDTHGSDYRYNLLQDSFDLCLSCHNQPMDNGQIANMQALLDENPQWHGPILSEDCSGCHQPHAGEYFRLLWYEYPEQFYTAYDPENYQLCFQCHSSESMTDSTTTSMTNFRNGEQNLHYLHVNRDKGRTCRSCHETHASQKAFHIRESVPYGSWELPINYTAMENGGSCSPGCHKTYEYQR